MGKSEVSMSGKAASFGGRMMGWVADQVLKQFADNFAAQVAALASQRAGIAAVRTGHGRPRIERPRDRLGRVHGLAARALRKKTA